MKSIFASPIFFIGVLIRLVLISTYTSPPLANWYAPFIQSSVEHFSLDPWDFWLNTGGSAVAFPYGYAMWLIFMPLAVLCKASSISIATAYSLTLIIADFSLLVLLRKMWPGHDRLLLCVYWLSPIIILASYVLGLNDLIPVLLLTFSCYLLKNKRFKFAAIILIASISAKLSMLLALPFFLIYMINNQSLRRLIPIFLRGLTIGIFVFLLPFFLSSGGLHMILSNPEMDKVYRAAIDLGGKTYIYLVPLIYTMMVYFVWRVRRLNYQLFYTILGISFLLIVLATPSSPGWFVWVVPLLVYYQIIFGSVAVLLASVLSFLYSINVLTHIQISLIDLDHFGLINNYEISEKFVVLTTSIVHTLMVAVGAILSLRIWRQTVSQNDYFRLSRKPFVIGIAGDSGSGKDTFSDSIKGLFGEHSVVSISGDDYHLYDRQKPIWRAMTPLNPKANDLEAFGNDLVALADGKAIRTKHYDHRHGKMTKFFTKKSNDIVLASGLHALYLPMFRDCYSLTIYLDMDEGLRREFKLIRDVTERHQSIKAVISSIERRELDALKFIRTQVDYADLVFSIKPIHPKTSLKLDMIDSAELSINKLKLVVKTKGGLNEASLIRVLVGVCGLHVDVDVVDYNNKDNFQNIITIEGDVSEDDISMATKILCPRVIEFLDLEPEWQGGIKGLMQLFTMAHIDQELTKRFI